MTTEFKGTSGNWEVAKTIKTLVHIQGRSICTTGNWTESLNSEKIDAENEANAKLIAASPDLLEALQNGVELMEYLINATPTGTVRNTMCDFNIIAQLAIKKALGL